MTVSGASIILFILLAAVVPLVPGKTQRLPAWLNSRDRDVFLRWFWKSNGCLRWFVKPMISLHFLWAAVEIWMQFGF